MKINSFFAVLPIAALLAFTTNFEKQEVDVSKSKVTWTGKKFTGEHTGTVQIKAGELQTQNGKLSGGSFTMDMRSITNTDIKDEKYQNKLVGHLKSPDFFGVEKYSTADLVITKTRVINGNKYQVDGNLTIKGISSPISFPAYVNITDDMVVAKADITIDRTKYDIKFKSSSFFDSLGDGVIYDDFEISVLLYTK